MGTKTESTQWHPISCSQVPISTSLNDKMWRIANWASNEMGDLFPSPITPFYPPLPVPTHYQSPNLTHPVPIIRSPITLTPLFTPSPYSHTQPLHINRPISLTHFPYHTSGTPIKSTRHSPISPFLGYRRLGGGCCFVFRVLRSCWGRLPLSWCPTPRPATPRAG